MPLISVIVPVYKVEKYIHRCVDSILAQTFTDFELILVDDGSPDNCGKICDEYAEKDSRIVVIHQENGGLSAARNAGLDWIFEHSDSQWISFVDSDDAIYDCYLDKMYSAVINTKTDISLCGMVDFETERLPELASIYEGSMIFSGIEACINLYSGNSKVSYVSSNSKLYRKPLFRDVRFPIGKIHEDQFTTYKLLYKAKSIVEIGEQLYGYYYNSNSIMRSKFSLKRYDDIEALDVAILFFENENEMFIADKAKKLKEILISKYSVFARNAKMYRQVPRKYRRRFIDVLNTITKHYGKDYCEYFMGKYYPNTVFFYSIVRKLLKMVKII